MKFWCKVPEDCDNAETCRSYVMERYIECKIVHLLLLKSYNFSIGFSPSLGYWAKYSGNSLTWFQDNQSAYLQGSNIHGP